MILKQLTEGTQIDSSKLARKIKKNPKQAHLGVIFYLGVRRGRNFLYEGTQVLKG